MATTQRRSFRPPQSQNVAGRWSAALLLLVASVVGVLSLAPPQPAWAASGDAQQLLNLINQERASVGAQPLSFRNDLVQVAEDHSAWMASTGTFQHRSDLSAGVTGPWTRIGENIAYGWSVTSIHQMFMASKGHCENNLYAGFNRAGIGFATGGNGAMYVTVVFVQESGGSLPKPTVCPYDYSTTTTTAPPPTTTTTVPATTSTTATPATTTSTTAPPPSTTTTVPSTTSTTVPPATTTSTTAAPTTTTTGPATTSTTAAPTATTVSGEAASVPVPSTTTTVATEGIPASTKPLASGSDGDQRAPLPIEPVAASAAPISSQQSNPLPLLPVAGGASLVAAVGIWWLIGAKKSAAAAAAQSSWNVPHGGTRPPQ